MIQEIPNPQLQLAFDFVEQTNTNLFLTGKAGTGKTTFLFLKPLQGFKTLEGVNSAETTF